MVSQIKAQERSSIEGATQPLPADLRSQATILSVKESGSFNTLHTGKNGYFCIADKQRDDRLSVECHPQSLRQYLERKQILVREYNKSARDSILTLELQSGEWDIPTGALSYFISGAINTQTRVPDSVWVWSEIAVPFATSETTGLPIENMGPVPWLMNDGKLSAHIMIGYEFVP